MIQNLSLEKRIFKILNLQNEETKNLFRIYRNYTKSYYFPDYLLKINENNFWLECKERGIIYNESWVKFSDIERKNAFALDETTIKTVFKYFPDFVIVIFDKITKYYYLFYPMDLLTINKTRYDRPIKKNEDSKICYKGKWVINLNDGYKFNNIIEVINDIYLYASEEKDKIIKMNECYNKNNDVIIMGKENLRTSEYWSIDLNNK